MNWEFDNKVVAINGTTYPVDPEIFKLLHTLTTESERYEQALISIAGWPSELVQTGTWAEMREIAEVALEGIVMEGG